MQLALRGDHNISGCGQECSRKLSPSSLSKHLKGSGDLIPTGGSYQYLISCFLLWDPLKKIGGVADSCQPSIKIEPY